MNANWNWATQNGYAMVSTMPSRCKLYRAYTKNVSSKFLLHFFLFLQVADHNHKIIIEHVWLFPNQSINHRLDYGCLFQLQTVVNTQRFSVKTYNIKKKAKVYLLIGNQMQRSFEWFFLSSKYFHACLFLVRKRRCANVRNLHSRFEISYWPAAFLKHGILASTFIFMFFFLYNKIIFGPFSFNTSSWEHTIRIYLLRFR